MNAQEQKTIKKALNSWNPSLESNPDLKRTVWSRIDKIESERRQQSVFIRLWNWVDQAEFISVKPVLASAFVILCILAGIVLAQKRIERDQEQVNRQYANQYIYMIDPVSKVAQMNTGAEVPDDRIIEPSTPPTSP